MSKTENTNDSTNTDAQFATEPNANIKYLGDWTSHYGLKKWFIPTGRHTDPIRIGKSITRSIKSFPETAETFKISDFDLEEESRWVAKALLFAHNVTEYSSRNRCVRYKNPNYIHYDKRIEPIKNTEKRLSFYNKYIAYGTISPKWIATHCGITTEQLRNVVNDQINKTPQQHRRENQIELGRTAKTLSQWGYRKSDLADALGIPRTTLISHINKVKDSWIPPAPPTEKEWFTPGDIESKQVTR